MSDIEDFQDLIDELEEKNGYKKYTYTVGFDPVKDSTSGDFYVVVNLDKHERSN
ncbi:MAG: hypothetical protein KUG81_08985 [Gammaproteobacteria bacterium]|nr:hypothetical protein [Gammaproteobacteria bacterium]